MVKPMVYPPNLVACGVLGYLWADVCLEERKSIVGLVIRSWRMRVLGKFMQPHGWGAVGIQPS